MHLNVPETGRVPNNASDVMIGREEIHPALVVYGNTLSKFTLFLARPTLELYLGWLRLVRTYVL